MILTATLANYTTFRCSYHELDINMHALFDCKLLATCQIGLGSAAVQMLPVSLRGHWLAQIY